MSKEMELLQDLARRIKAIRFKPDMLPTDVRQFRIDLSEIFAEARPIYAEAKRDVDRFDRIRRNAEKKIVVNIETLIPADQAPDKWTDKTREAKGIEWLEENPIGTMGQPIYELLSEAEALLSKADAVMEMIKDKNDALIAIRDMINAEVKLDPVF